ncbi:hypothetical protein [Glycomyces buryatensis]|uniref:DUF4190 domain-containing protein n=1 Tax=Glycomyces buryatensis TaxID=2570927 RepID=A0A4S8PYA4_9ACTN|nr:hypothetical protein [Glycomyces buryatensis]THV35641.1 hypothetical protein FAB82_22460 [Glycomyces buryatensis]
MVEVQHAGGVRHPDDPEPVESSKVVAAQMLAGIGVALSLFVGGVVPAIMALILASQAERDIAASGGFLLGAGKLRRIRKLAWIAIGIAGAIVLAVVLVWIVGMARSAGQTSYDGDVAFGFFLPNSGA